MNDFETRATRQFLPAITDDDKPMEHSPDRNPPTPERLTQLSDTPPTLTGNRGRALRVSSDETHLEFRRDQPGIVLCSLLAIVFLVCLAWGSVKALHAQQLQREYDDAVERSSPSVAHDMYADKAISARVLERDAWRLALIGIVALAGWGAGRR